MDTNTTRRKLLQFGTSAAAYAAGAAIVAGGVAVASEAKGATSTISPGLRSLMDQRAAADARLLRFYDTVQNPATGRNYADVEAHRAKLAAVPHVHEEGGLALGGSPIVFSSRKGHSRQQAENYIAFDAAEPNRGGDWNATIDAARRYIRAEDQRNAAIAALGKEPGVPAWINERETELFKPVDRLDNAIDSFPAATLADLAAKLDCIKERGCEPDNLLELMHGDISRLARGARA